MLVISGPNTPKPQRRMHGARTYPLALNGLDTASINIHHFFGNFVSKGALMAEAEESGTQTQQRQLSTQRLQALKYLSQPRVLRVS